MASGKPTRKRLELAYYRCPHGVGCIMLDTGDFGTRLTGMKCCGRWNKVQSFLLDQHTVDAINDEWKGRDDAPR